MTEFVRGKRPRVRICAELAGDTVREVRWTTLAHEFGHVHLHDALFGKPFGENKNTPPPTESKI